MKKYHNSLQLSLSSKPINPIGILSYLNKYTILLCMITKKVKPVVIHITSKHDRAFSNNIFNRFLFYEFIYVVLAVSA